MALADLIARLEQDAEARVQELRERAEAEVRAVEAEALRVAGEASSLRLEQRRRGLEATLQRELSEARQRARAEVLAARRALFGRILARADALLPEVAASPEYRAQVPAHAQEALTYLEGLRPMLHCSPAFASLLEPLGRAREDVFIQAREGVAPGVVAEAADGSVRVDNTLPARLRRLEARLTIELLRAAEGEPS